jgi:hypothetical protein
MMLARRLQIVLCVAALFMVAYLMGFEVGSFYEQRLLAEREYRRIKAALQEAVNHVERYQEESPGPSAQSPRRADGESHPPIEDQEGGEI